MTTEQFLELYKMEREYDKLIQERGYKHGVWIIDESWPSTPLMIGHGFVWSEHQQAMVVGCLDKDNNYYTAVPIYKPETDWWAKLAE